MDVCSDVLIPYLIVPTYTHFKYNSEYIVQMLSGAQPEGTSLVKGRKCLTSGIHSLLLLKFELLYLISECITQYMGGTHTWALFGK